MSPCLKDCPDRPHRRFGCCRCFLRASCRSPRRSCARTCRRSPRTALPRVMSRTPVLQAQSQARPRQRLLTRHASSRVPSPHRIPGPTVCGSLEIDWHDERATSARPTPCTSVEAWGTRQNGEDPSPTATSSRTRSTSIQRAATPAAPPPAATKSSWPTCCRTVFAPAPPPATPTPPSPPPRILVRDAADASTRRPQRHAPTAARSGTSIPHRRQRRRTPTAPAFRR